MTLEQFTTELKRWTFKAFGGGLDARTKVAQRVAELRDRGVKPITISTYLRPGSENR